EYPWTKTVLTLIKGVGVYGTHTWMTELENLDKHHQREPVLKEAAFKLLDLGVVEMQYSTIPYKKGSRDEYRITISPAAETAVEMFHQEVHLISNANLRKDDDDEEF